MSTPASADGSGSGTGRILVVDDDAAFRATVARALVALGHEVVEAYDGVAALRALRPGAFHAILSDISMPELDGLALVGAVRRIDPDVPVVLVTGAPARARALGAVEAGAMLYLVKPVDLEALEQVVAHAIQKARIARLRRLGATSGAMPFAAPERESMSGTLDAALASVGMACQPVIRVDGGAVFGCEVLARTDEPRLASPRELFAAAERLGRTTELGRTIRRAIAELLAAMPGPLVCFVNVHPEELADDMLLGERDPLFPHASRVVLELTERRALEALDDVARRAARLCQLGYRLAIDDLGAGYAGLNSLALLSPWGVKLDMSLVRGIEADAKRLAIAASVVRLCRDLGVEVIAEGVETPGERDALRSIDCTLQQGFLFGRPERKRPPT